MKRLVFLVPWAALVGCTAERGSPPADADHSHLSGGEAHDHDHADPHTEYGVLRGVLMVQTEPKDVQAGVPVTLEMMIHGADGAMVEDFEVIHEKKFHLIIVREGLDEFAHVHPDLEASGKFVIRHTFPKAGTYRLYVDHKPAGQPQATAVGAVEVRGDSSPAEKLSPNAPGRVQGDGLAADVSVEAAVPGATVIAFQVFEGDEPVADLEPYLGAMGHLVVIGAAGQEYVHAHPTEVAQSAPDGRVSFGAQFLKPGIYKGWGQFQRNGLVYTIPFVIEIGTGG
jgi:hypothetical protein